jgi:pyridoxamine 5'-phosphate oxidase
VVGAAPRLTGLPEIEAALWRELAACVDDRGHAWRVGVLATSDGDGADARSVILRECDTPSRTLLLFTDSRSPKVSQIAAHPRGMLVLWSASLGWQLRLRVLLQVESAGLRVSSRWARMKMTPGAHDYLSPLPPGSPLEHAVQTRESRGHFAVVAARVESVDWLELHADGHRRALFDTKGGRWIAP